MKTNETGRSMIEMLGVLAIIGVLSVGGIAGYTSAMRSYKANEIINSTSMLYMMGISSNAGAGDADLSYSSVMGTLPAECAGIDYSGSTKEITVKVQDQAVCYQVKNKLGDKVTSGDCTTATSGAYTLTVTLGDVTTSTETPCTADDLTNCTKPECNAISGALWVEGKGCYCENVGMCYQGDPWDYCVERSNPRSVNCGELEV